MQLGKAPVATMSQSIVWESSPGTLLPHMEQLFGSEGGESLYIGNTPCTNRSHNPNVGGRVLAFLSWDLFIVAHRGLWGWKN